LEKWLPEMNPEDRSRTEALIRHLKMTRNGLINEASETLRGRDYCHADSPLMIAEQTQAQPAGEPA
jgi:hypothetical protein